MTYANLVDLAELKSDLGLKTSDVAADAAIGRAIATASQRLQDLAGQPLVATAGVAVSFVPTVWGEFQLVRFWPVRSIDTITRFALSGSGLIESGEILAATTEESAALATVVELESLYYLALVGGWSPNYRYVVSLTVGPDDPPADVVDFAKQLAAVTLRNFAVDGVGRDLVGVQSIAEDDGTGGWKRTFARRDMAADQLAIVNRYGV